MSRPSSIHSSHEQSDPATSQSQPDEEKHDGEQLQRPISSASEAPYSVYSRSQKALIVGTVAFAALFSPFTINIYYPAILDIAGDLDVAIDLINLSITIYMIFQGLTPGIFAAFSDSVGRRPTYMICFIVYIAANIGLALSDTYWLLMLLRAIQATGNSATVALGAGVIADIATSQERGGYLGIFGVGPLCGPSLGPVIGGALAQSLGWRSIFWFLAIFSGVFTVFMVLFLPETLRSLVGNGGVKPRSLWHVRLVDAIPRWFHPGREESEGDLESRTVGSAISTLAPRKRTNVLESFKILLQKDVSLVLFIPGIHYAVYIMVTTSTPILFNTHYGLNPFHIGLTYLALGAGTLIGSVGYGKILDRDWRVIEQRYIQAGGSKPKSPQDLYNFPLEVARMRSAWWPLIAFWVCCAGYGWTVQYSVNLAAPLVLQCIMGGTMVCILSSFQALLIDMHPGRSASAAASLNIVRCWLGAAGSAVTQPMLEKLNVGWTYTLLAILCAILSTPLVLGEQRWGAKWRREREDKLAKKKAEREKKAQGNAGPAAELEETIPETAEEELPQATRLWSGSSDHVRH